MRKKQKETDASGDEKKDDDDADEQKKPSSPSRVESSPQYFDSAAGPPAGYCILNMLFCFDLCRLSCSAFCPSWDGKMSDRLDWTMIEVIHMDRIAFVWLYTFDSLFVDFTLIINYS